MFLANELPNRRQFLERSAWGFGSAFLLPSLLLESCTDHVIPPPNPPTPPPLGDYDIDYEDAARTTLIAAVGAIPVVGELLAPMVDILWPSSGDAAWNKVRAQAEALINQKIAENVYDTVQGNLDGLLSVLHNYQHALNDSTPAVILTQWLNARNDFDLYRPNFQQQGDELLLLATFTQFANLHLTLLRDPLTILRDSNGKLIVDSNGFPIITGASWGMTDADLKQLATDLQSDITSYTDYAKTWFLFGKANVAQNTNFDFSTGLEPFLSINQYERQMTLSVLDFVNTWPYLDVTKYPNGYKDGNGNAIDILTREIYSDPMGSVINSDPKGPIVLPTTPPTQLPTQIAVQNDDSYIFSIKVTYPANSGPDGVTQTPQMGWPSSIPAPTVVNNDDPVNNPLQKVVVTHTFGRVLTSLQFTNYKGQSSPVFGNNQSGQNNQSTTWFYPTEALSSAYIHGLTKYSFGYADCIVLGFKHWIPPKVAVQVVRHTYITSPKEPSLDKFFPKLGVTSALITNEWKAARKAYQEWLEAWVKAHK